MSPDYTNEHSPFSDQNNHYQKYINYILAKALYMNIVYGEEALAGPMWFREAFALYAAGLYLNENIEFTKVKLISIVQNPAKNKSNDYTMVMEYIDQNGDIKSFVEIAGQKYLTDSLISFIEVNFVEDVQEKNGN
ncbi:MAG: hypothetical protein EOM76_04835 [Sphingobacteriia bacterium]|nr:hypothetical protein [Sphingobacteriia bacterium]